jgi:hypothetical protein
MIEFKDLKKLIIKSCKSVDNTDLNNAYGFVINVDKLNKILSQATDNKKENIRIAMVNENKEGDPYVINSKVPQYNIDDIEDILEYTQNPSELSDMFNGKSQIARFILIIENEDIHGTPVATLEDLTEKPIYRALIVHKFNKKREKFEYSIYFRSNKVMMQYISDLKESGEAFNDLKDCVIE